MVRTQYVKTIDFGDVPIRKTHTEGIEQALIELSSYKPEEAYASIRTDLRTNQPFAVLLDENLKEIYD